MASGSFTASWTAVDHPVHSEAHSSYAFRAEFKRIVADGMVGSGTKAFSVLGLLPTNLR